MNDFSSDFDEQTKATIKVAVKRALRHYQLSRRRYGDDLKGEAAIAALTALRRLQTHPVDNAQGYVYRAVERALTAYVLSEWDVAKRIKLTGAEPLLEPDERDPEYDRRPEGRPSGSDLPALDAVQAACVDAIDSRIVELRVKACRSEEPAPTLEEIATAVGLTKSAIWKRLRKIAQRAGI